MISVPTGHAKGSIPRRNIVILKNGVTGISEVKSGKVGDIGASDQRNLFRSGEPINERFRAVIGILPVSKLDWVGSASNKVLNVGMARLTSTRSKILTGVVSGVGVKALDQEGHG